MVDSCNCMHFHICVYVVKKKKRKTEMRTEHPATRLRMACTASYCVSTSHDLCVHEWNHGYGLFPRCVETQCAVTSMCDCRDARVQTHGSNACSLSLYTWDTICTVSNCKKKCSIRAHFFFLKKKFLAWHDESLKEF